MRADPRCPNAGPVAAAYFGAGAAALTGLAAGVLFVAMGAHLLRRR